MLLVQSNHIAQRGATAWGPLALEAAQLQRAFLPSPLRRPGTGLPSSNLCRLASLPSCCNPLPRSCQPGRAVQDPSRHGLFSLRKTYLTQPPPPNPLPALPCPCSYLGRVVTVREPSPKDFKKVISEYVDGRNKRDVSGLSTLCHAALCYAVLCHDAPRRAELSCAVPFWAGAARAAWPGRGLAFQEGPRTPRAPHSVPPCAHIRPCPPRWAVAAAKV